MCVQLSRYFSLRLVVSSQLIPTDPSSVSLIADRLLLSTAVEYAAESMAHLKQIPAITSQELYPLKTANSAFSCLLSSDEGRKTVSGHTYCNTVVGPSKG